MFPSFLIPISLLLLAILAYLYKEIGINYREYLFIIGKLLPLLMILIVCCIGFVKITLATIGLTLSLILLVVLFAFFAIAMVLFGARNGVL